MTQRAQQVVATRERILAAAFAGCVCGQHEPTTNDDRPAPTRPARTHGMLELIALLAVSDWIMVPLVILCVIIGFLVLWNS